jgi:NADPH2:quinone reductase
MTEHNTGLQLRSLIKSNGILELSLLKVPTPIPAVDEVVVQIEASPINPSDLAVMFASADIGTAKVIGTSGNSVLSANIPEKTMKGLAGRIEKSLPVGNEGSGRVIAAGSSPSAQALIGKTVAVLGGAMYSQYRCVKVSQCMPLPEGTTAAEGASSFVNPLTSLGMVETMRREGHSALVHTAAASNLGQMLNRICIKDEIRLVNIVRKPEQADILKELGAKYICDSTSPCFMQDLTAALAETGATIAFDAIGGGRLAGQILNCMEAAIGQSHPTSGPYGSTVHKQVYIYGGLDMSATEFVRGFGMTWGMGGWLLTGFLQKIGPQRAMELQARVASELKTTFLSTYSNEISLAELLQLDVIADYTKRATGAKYLLRPNR